MRHVQMHINYKQTGYEASSYLVKLKYLSDWLASYFVIQQQYLGFNNSDIKQFKIITQTTQILILNLILCLGGEHIFVEFFCIKGGKYLDCFL